MQGRLKDFDNYLPFLQEKSGLEIGGPSKVFRPGQIIPLYEELGTLDNCDFSQSTMWAKHNEAFVFDPGKPAGKTLFCDGSALVTVANETYQVVLSSHNLEHFANPVKALREWQRVLQPEGALVLVLPYYAATFDHRRQPTPVEHMIDDFERNTGEDDLTHLPEILARHDLAMDPLAGSLDNFQKRSLENFSNRCLHHHVFNEHNSRDLLTKVGFEVLSIERAAPDHLCILAKKTSL